MFGAVETADGYVMLAIGSEKTFQNLVKNLRSSGMDRRFQVAKYVGPARNWKTI